MYNTIIIGAGPVGSYLAGKLAGLGYNVLVLDKKSAAGQDVCCTGIISKECFNLLPADINLAKRPVSSARFLAPSGKSLKFSRSDEVAYIIDRVALEQVLADYAQASDVRYLFGSEVIDIQNTKGCLQVTANCAGHKTIFDAETAVIATGFGSPLPARLGLGEISNFVIGAQAEVSIMDIDDIEIYFDRRLAPEGFSWLVPIGDNKGLVGQLTRRQPKRYFRKLLSALKTQGKIATTECAPAYRLIPLQSLPKTHSDRLLVVGEAAGQVKPTTGGGIYYGLICADIAADTLHKAFQLHEFSESRLAAYEKRWRARLGREIKIGYWSHRIYRMLNNRQIEGLYNFISRNGMPQFIAELDDFPFDWHRDLILKTLKHLAVAIPEMAIKPLMKH
ncbi:MAG: NAD(P)/FAD-dependent oxidoreductase [Dehalococcoidia bacterium]|nr:NAD(P)/FAD-dependent oxidoreductase [Dehalococcoidia bacterium]